MLESLHNKEKLGEGNAQFEQLLSLDKVGYAIALKDAMQLKSALNSLVSPLNLEAIKFIEEKVVKSNWPRGADIVVEHYHKLRGGISVASQWVERRLLIRAVKEESFKLAEHVWGVASPDAKEECTELGVRLGLAVVLVKLGQEKYLNDQAKMNLIGPGLEVMSNPGPNEYREGVKEVLKLALRSQYPATQVELWSQVCKTDNPWVLQELLKEEVISAENIKGSSPLKFVLKAMHASETAFRMGKDLGWIAGKLLSMQGGLEKTKLLNLPEIVCLLTTKNNKVLAYLLEDEEFRDGVFKSSIAKNALMHVCASDENIVGVLKGQGVDLDQVKGDDQKTPLHIYAKEYLADATGGAAGFIELAKMHPKWILEKDANEKTPIDLIPPEDKDEILPSIEVELLRYEVAQSAIQGGLEKSLRV